jgi:hypothetical protein
MVGRPPDHGHDNLEGPKSPRGPTVPLDRVRTTSVGIRSMSQLGHELPLSQRWFSEVEQTFSETTRHFRKGAFLRVSAGAADGPGSE